MTCTVPSSWAQGRTVFGGLSTCFMLEAARSLVVETQSLRALQANFIAPLLTEQPLQLVPRVLRAGRSTVCAVELQQDGAVVAHAVGTFSESREGRPNLAPLPMPETKSRDDVEPMPYIEGVTPAFTQHYDVRRTAGDWPYTGSDARGHQGFVRHRDEDACDLDSDVLAILYTDAWPSPSVARFDGFAPTSSMAWHLDFTQAACDDPRGYWFLRSDDEASDAGFSQMRGAIYGPQRQLIALSSQTVLLGKPRS